jgi:hypothetical protein
MERNLRTVDSVKTTRATAGKLQEKKAQLRARAISTPGPYHLRRDARGSMPKRLDTKEARCKRLDAGRAARTGLFTCFGENLPP